MQFAPVHLNQPDFDFPIDGYGNFVINKFMFINMCDYIQIREGYDLLTDMMFKLCTLVHNSGEWRTYHEY